MINEIQYVSFSSVNCSYSAGRLFHRADFSQGTCISVQKTKKKSWFLLMQPHFCPIDVQLISCDPLILLLLHIITPLFSPLLFSACFLFMNININYFFNYSFSASLAWDFVLVFQSPSAFFCFFLFLHSFSLTCHPFTFCSVLLYRSVMAVPS